MIKFRLYYDKDKEEAFLNNMVEKGYAMKSFILGFYSFEKCKPNEYTYRVDLLTGKNFREKSDYIQLVKESGGEYIQMWGPWAIFRKKGAFELYTDNESKVAFYSNIRRMFFILAIAELCISFGQWQLLFQQWNNRALRIYTIILIGLLTTFILTFICQVYKCTRIIKSLKEEI